MFRTTCLGCMSFCVSTWISLTSPCGVTTTRADNTPVRLVMRFSARFTPHGSWAGVAETVELFCSGASPAPLARTGFCGVTSLRSCCYLVPAARLRPVQRAIGCDQHIFVLRSEEHTSELQSPVHLVCRL